MDSLNIDNIFEEKSQNNITNIQDKVVKFTFYITYAFLMTTATVTFIEAIRTKDIKIRNILNLETCISIVAAFFYGMFMKKINVKEINYKDINVNRYVDWSITTPIMLLVLILAFSYNNNKKVTLQSFLLILVLNYGMLLFGFLGENKLYDKLKSNIIGFLFFCCLYGYLYFTHIHGFNKFDNNILYFSFITLWGLYGVAYWMEERKKNVAYNILDLFSKCFVGIFFWAYFTKAIVLKK
jgi:bacteriorhodopsin